MNAIGGYFELELSKGNQEYHQTHALKSGRAALHFILKHVKAKKIYIPFYTCDALLEPIKEVEIPFEFYSITEAFDPKHLPTLNKNEYFLYIDYFDLKRDIVEILSRKYGVQLIVDCSQAFFLKANGRSWFFNSCRKFFGVPDGAYLYAPDSLQVEVNFERNKNFTVQHLIKRKLQEVEEGYAYYLQNEELCGPELKQMSQLSEDLLSNVQYECCIKKRNKNFQILHTALKQKNLFQYSEAGRGVPMAYPFLPIKNIPHQHLWDHDLFVPIFWKDVLNRSNEGFEIEKDLTRNLLALPVDQRYDEDDMCWIIDQLQCL